jgi:SAM-dependent methyltransferase
MVTRDLDTFISRLKSVVPRLDVSDDELIELFWQGHPRFQFFTSLPWSTNLLDLGAGSGGLAHWKNWVKPARPDLTLYGVDRSVGEHRALYAGWEAIDLDREQPKFSGVPLIGFFVCHLIEQLAAPEALIEWMGTRAEPGARLYIEWPSPASAALPSREELRKHQIEVVVSNFHDDQANRTAPDLATVCGWLNAAGFTVISSGPIDLGIFGEELFARGTDRDGRSMGYWSMTHSALHAVAVKSETAGAVPRASIAASPSSEPQAGQPSIRSDAETPRAPSNEPSEAAQINGPSDMPDSSDEPWLAGDMEEITAPFTDVAEWNRFSERNPHLSDPRYIEAIAENAKQNGAWSAFFGRISAGEIDVQGEDYREQLLARGLNSRCRAILELMAAEPWFADGQARIYAAEAVTPFALLMRGRFARFVGSEYASTEEARDALFPIPFQDLENLTFPADRFDCVVTNDCLEHVADIRQCLSEMCRVLRPGGVMLSTFPFTFHYESDIRARLVDGRIEHLMEPEYHGNPAEPEAGSLVFEVPGWNIFDRTSEVGFSRAEMVFVSGMRRAITGAEIGGIFVYRCYK